MKPKISEIAWRYTRGGAGIEFGLVGFGVGVDLFHAYIRLGVVTLYVTARNLPAFVAMYRAARDALRSSSK